MKNGGLGAGAAIIFGKINLCFQEQGEDGAVSCPIPAHFINRLLRSNARNPLPCYAQIADS